METKKMSQARWIWYNGDFEIYHSVQLHSRREEFGHSTLNFWSLSAPYPNVRFYKSYVSDEEETVRFVSPHKAEINVDNKRYPANCDVRIPAGKHDVMVIVIAKEGLPCLYVNSKYLVTDGTWVADHVAGDKIPVGDTPAYTRPNDDPTKFAFSYERKEPVKCTVTEQGFLYDFGREMFGILHIEGALENEPMHVSYGESAEEACDFEYTLVHEDVAGKSEYTLVPRAFRYICLGTKQIAKPTVWAEYEYLPLEYRADFACNRKSVKKIWDICAYTLHLNSREFFLDGIKRDRWCWSGDAYQSYMANNYLFFDPDLTRRTIIALLGKPPYEQHINTIADYSMYLIIAANEYYFNTGDKQFIEIYYPRLLGLYNFIQTRLNESGYVDKIGEDDWIFIDWSDIDKGGALCAEQILLWQCRNAMASLSEVCGLDGDGYRRDAEKLKRSIMRDYWREDRGGFVDCYTTGKENITRHANIFAIMYDFVSQKRARKIVHSVLENDAITHITTPYFEFFELCALCKMGKLGAAQKKIESYWGGMVALGATSIWEEYIPEKVGAEHYEMYGMKYGCSLCHAWGGGPIYLLGRYCLGVYPTSVGYKTYAVEPNRGAYKSIDGRAPLPDGDEVRVKMDSHSCTVTTTRKGGVLKLKGREYPLTAGQPLTVEF
jgi:hypothetical protein